MKIVISAGTVKRKIDGNFSICVDRATATAIVGHMQRFLNGESVYGWVDIYDAPLIIPDTEPEDWE